MRGEVTRDAAAGAEEGDVHAGEAVGSEFLDRHVLAFEFHLLSGTAGTGEKGELADWETALFKTAQHFHTHRSGGANDGDVFQVTHDGVFLVLGKRARRVGAICGNARGGRGWT